MDWFIFHYIFIGTIWLFMYHYIHFFNIKSLDISSPPNFLAFSPVPSRLLDIFHRDRFRGTFCLHGQLKFFLSRSRNYCSKEWFIRFRTSKIRDETVFFWLFSSFLALNSYFLLELFGNESWYHSLIITVPKIQNDLLLEI